MARLIKTPLRHCFAGILLAGVILLVAAPALAVDEAMLKRMEELIQQQQRQIEAQAKAIEKLQQQMGTMKEEVMEAAKQEIALVADPTPTKAMVSHKEDKVKLELYGQANRAAMVADDGDNSDYYFVDNDASSSRIGFLGSAKVNDDITVGTRMEFEYQSNPSNVVNQNDKNPDGDSFDDRWIDAQITSKRFGKLYLGKGDTATNNIAEIDLSGTALGGYSDIDINAGGILWYDDESESLPGVNVGDVFNNMDGLSRRNRIRYDTPSFYGVTLSTSALSDGGDVALRYAAKLGAFKVAAGAGYANPQAINRDIEHQLSGSASILHDSGLNLTLAGGVQDFENDATDSTGRDRNDANFYYAKLGYRAKFFEAGETRFGIDYARHNRIDANGDEADTVGFQIVQDMSEWGTEYFIGYRWHALDRDNFNDTDFEDVNTMMSGVRVKF